MNGHALTSVARSPVLRLAAAAAGGALLGLAAYLLRGIGGFPLYVLVGVLAGVAVAGLFQLYVRSVSLTEIKVNVPQVSQLTFVVNNDAQRTAWEMFVEVSTRVATQPLADDEGFLREASSSLYHLFSRTRELLAQSQPTKVSRGRTVEYLALTMLNRELRPFLSKWHPLLTAFEQSSGHNEAAWEHNASCREQLEGLRQRLVEYAVSFARLAGVADPHALLATH